MADKRKEVGVADPDNASHWRGGTRVGEEPSGAPDRATVEDELEAARARTAELEAELEALPVEWQPPAGHVVTDDKTLFILIGGARYEHVSEAPDGRWVYKRS